MAEAGGAGAPGRRFWGGLATLRLPADTSMRSQAAEASASTKKAFTSRSDAVRR